MTNMTKSHIYDKDEKISGARYIFRQDQVQDPESGRLEFLELLKED